MPYPIASHIDEHDFGWSALGSAISPMPLQTSPEQLWAAVLPGGHIMHVGKFCECVEMVGRVNMRRLQATDALADVRAYP